MRPCLQLRGGVRRALAAGKLSGWAHARQRESLPAELLHDDHVGAGISAGGLDVPDPSSILAQRRYAGTESDHYPKATVRDAVCREYNHGM